MKEDILSNGNIRYNVKNGVEYIQFKNLLKYEKQVIHGFSTRIGGVSTGECSTMNFGFNRNDSRENVYENFKRMAEVLEIKTENMVFSNQVHGNRVKLVDEKDRGKGIYIKSDIIGFDGLVTDRKEVVLVTFYADCVPVFFFDPKKLVIASSHSGWRGTVKRIAAVTLEKMEKEFGCRPEDVEIAIGPSIGQCCFEVGEEVYREFSKEFSSIYRYCTKKENGKYHINLQGIIENSLIDSGASSEKICISNICTKCNNNVFFSHRGDNGKTGSLAGFIQLR